MPAISIKIKNATLVAKKYERLRKAVPEISRQRLYATALAIVADMKEVAPKPTYPIQWDSERQRIAYFATDAFTLKGRRPNGYVNKNIPYKRTGRYVKAWKVVKSPAGRGPAAAGYLVVNPLEHAYHIGGKSSGKKQSRIHRERWNLFRERMDYHVARLPKTVISHIKVTAHREGFIVQ